MAGEIQQFGIEELIQDGALLVNDGYRAKNSELSRIGIPFARAGNINGGFHFDDADRVPPETLARVGLKRSKPGDVVFTSKGTVGRFAFVRERTPEFVYSPQLCFWRSGNKNRINPRWLYYWMNGHEFFLQYKGVAGQTDMAEYVSLRDQRAMRITLPPLPKQKAIAHILGTLDDKIELNRKMNETLEAMARAIFKSWFVDFDPVRAKMEGRWRKGESLPGLPAHFWEDLFPDRLVDSELGKIPEGWEAGVLGNDLAELVSGARPKGGAVEEGIPSVGAENVIGLGLYDFSKEKFIPHDFFEQLRERGAAIKLGDVLLYKDGAQIGRKTYFDRGFPHAHCAINEHCFILRLKHRWMQRYVFFWLDLPWITEEIVALNSNSAQPGINQAGIRHLPLLRAQDAVIQQFDHLAQSFLDKIFENCHESRTLAAIRDALLPKLLSGEICVKDVKKIAEAHL